MGLGNLLNRFSGEIWAMRPETLESFVSVLLAKDSGSNVAALLNSGLLKPDGGDFGAESIVLKRDNTLIVNVHGTLMHKASYMDAMCGMQSYSDLESCIESNKKGVDNILFDFDTPGGSAIGVELLAKYILNLSNSHYTIALNTGSLSSAGYYLASACDSIYAQDGVVSTGCVGCVMCHIDQSSADAKEGLKYTYITSGDLKAAGNSHEALAAEMQSILQESVDNVAEQFLSFISDVRPFTESQLSEIKRGGSYTASKALSLGLIDGVKSLKEILNG